MRAFRIILLSSTIFSSSLFTFSANAADSTVTLSCVSFSWPETIYRPLVGGNVSFGLSYQNNCTYEVLLAKYILIDKFGTQIASNSIVGLKSGVKANQNQQWSDFFLAKGTEPFTLQLIVENFSSLGISNPSPINFPFKFTERTSISATPTPTVTVTSKPTPAPTVTVTASSTNRFTETEFESLKLQLEIVKNNLKAVSAKLKKVCSVKPKPKGC